MIPNAVVEVPNLYYILVSMDEVEVDDQPDPSFISEEGYFTHSYLEVARDLNMISLIEKKNKRESLLFPRRAIRDTRQESSSLVPFCRIRIVMMSDRGPWLQDYYSLLL